LLAGLANAVSRRSDDDPSKDARQSRRQNPHGQEQDVEPMGEVEKLFPLGAAFVFSRSLFP